jgi:uncharacterized protein (DUF1499 family)
MRDAAAETPQKPSLWCSRLAVFALVLIGVVALLHRFFGLPTAVALNAVAAGFLLAALALALGLIGMIGVWRTGGPGAARIALGVALSLALLAVPFSVGLMARSYPVLNDVTTDPADPPAYRALAGVRTGMANPAAYPGSKFAALQASAYPDMKPMDVNRPPAETFDLVVDVLKRLQMTIVAEEPPTDETPAGRAEAFDRTLFLGFYDDISVRVMPIGDPTDPQSRIDLRSSSRYGRSDFGANAQRLRDVMREIVARLEATVPAPGEVPVADGKKLKPGKNADREKAGGRTSRDDARRDTRRAPERRAPPP